MKRHEHWRLRSLFKPGDLNELIVVDEVISIARGKSGFFDAWADRDIARQTDIVCARFVWDDPSRTTVVLRIPFAFAKAPCALSELIDEMLALAIGSAFVQSKEPLAIDCY